MTFVGIFIGSLMAGNLADIFGRKKAMIGCVLIGVVIQVSMAFMPTWWSFGKCLKDLNEFKF